MLRGNLVCPSDHLDIWSGMSLTCPQQVLRVMLVDLENATTNGQAERGNCSHGI